MIYCISDIHGDFVRYKTMLEHIGFSDNLEVQRMSRDPYPVGPGWWHLLDLELPYLYEADPDLAVLEIKENGGCCRVDFRPSEAHRHYADVLADMESAIESQSAIICENCGEYIKGKPARYTSYCKRCFYLPTPERLAVREAMREKYFRHSHARHGPPQSREEVRGVRLPDVLRDRSDNDVFAAAAPMAPPGTDGERIKAPAKD